MFKKKGKGGSAAGGAGVRCTAAGCKGGWVEFEVTKELPVRNERGAIIGYEPKTGVTNEKCGVCDGTGWA